MWPAVAFVWPPPQSLLRGAAACVAAAGPRLPFPWQAQYTEPPGGAAVVQYTELPGGAAARVAAAGPRLPFVSGGAAARAAAAGPWLPFVWLGVESFMALA